MNRILLILLCALSWSAEIALFAITHPQCGHCQRWHSDVYPEYDEVAGLHGLPNLTVIDYADSSSHIWLTKNQIELMAFPTFVLMAGKEVLATFPGYSDKAGFYGKLRDELHKIKYPIADMAPTPAA